MARMRLFLGIELTPPARRHLVELQRSLRQVVRDVSFTKAQNLHLTLKFLGEVADQDVASVCGALGAMKRRGPVELSADELCLLPERGPVRIVAAGVSSPPAALLDLVSELEDVCGDRGFPRENRRFRAHMTLARARRPLGGGLRKPLVEAAAPAFPGPAMMVESFVLMQSQLDPRGSVYTPVAKLII